MHSRLVVRRAPGAVGGPSSGESNNGANGNLDHPVGNVGQVFLRGRDALRRDVREPHQKSKANAGDGQQRKEDPTSGDLLMIHAGGARLDAVAGPASMAAPAGRRRDKAKHAGDRHDEGDEPERHQGDREYGCEEVHAACSGTLVRLPALKAVAMRALGYGSGACFFAVTSPMRRERGEEGVSSEK